MNKRFISIILVISMVLIMIPLGTVAAFGVEKTDDVQLGLTPPANFVYFINHLNWEGPFFCYYWNEQGGGQFSWPGEAMWSVGTDDNGDNVYCFDVPIEYDNIIISCSDYRMSVDIPIDDHITVYFTGETDSYGRYKYETGVPPKGRTGKEKVNLLVDGKNFEVEQGKTYIYSYYLNVQNKVSAFDAATYYDTKGVEWSPILVNDEIDEGKMFPIASKGALTANYYEHGRIFFNGIKTSGYSFNSNDARLIITMFRVTAIEGTYEINTTINTFADTDNHKYVYNGKVLDGNFTAYGIIEEAPLLGDVDLDNFITIMDASYIQRYIAQIEKNMSDASKFCADVDADGSVTIIDSTFIQRFLAHLDCPKGIGKSF